MIKKKKAELSINMIVVVAIAIIILVIVIYLVANSGRGVGVAVSCPNMGGACVSINNCATTNYLSADCSGINEVCCPMMHVRTGS